MGFEDWKFEEVENTFPEIPEGEHRVRIEKAEKQKSKNGRDMIKIQLEVSNYKGKLWYYLVFLDEYPEITNSNLTSIFKSFGIKPGNFNLKDWEGKVGAAKVYKDEEYGPKVHYFLNKEQQQDLPKWVNPDDAKPQQKNETMEEVNDDDDLPF